MKKNLVRSLVLGLILSFTSLTQAAPQTFKLDPSHTYVLWRIKHLGFSTQSGKWYASGTLVLDKDNPKNDKVNAIIDVADVVTGLPELDKHLRSDQFFNTLKYPTATFVSNKVTLVNDKAAKVSGMLTLRGVSRPVTLNVVFNQMGQNPITDNNTVGFSATGQIKRSDFGMTAFLPLLGDEVQLDIEAEAFQPKPMRG